jgi:UDP-2,3-diacylglucosamine pyrophosphatase LpxH
LATSHGARDDILNFTPTLLLLLGFLGLAALATALVVAWAALTKQKPGTSRLLSLITRGISATGILATLALAALIGTPQLVRTGDTPPQLALAPIPNGSGVGIAVAFVTDRPTLNSVQYGPVGGARKVISEARAVKQHWLELKGLEPGQLYEYSVNGKGSTGFRTPPAAGQPVRFALAGDPHFGAPATGPTASMLEQIRKDPAGYAALFLLGDLNDRGYNDAFWKQALTTMSATTSGIPAGYVLGNHDSMFGGDRLFREYLRGPDASGQLWQRLDFGNVHVLLLDLEWELEVYTSEEQAWLEKQLASIPAGDWCIVMSHTFYYASGRVLAGWDWYDNQATIREVTPLFEKYGVDLVFSGHIHQAEILEKNGVTYAIAGTFGGPLEPPRAYTSPASRWYHTGTYGFMEVTIEAKTATIAFRAADGRELYRTVVPRK